MSDITIVPYHQLPSSFYQQHANNLFYAPAWIQVLKATYAFSFFTALDPTVNRFIIFALTDSPVGRKIVSLPFSDYTDIPIEQSVPLWQAIRQAYPAVPMVLRAAGANAFASDDSPLGKPVRQAYYHRVATQDATAAESNQSASFRRGTRKAVRSGVTVHCSHEREALREFYALYHPLRMHKFESIPQPYAFFERVWEGFIANRQGFMLQARHEGQLLAAIIVLQYRHVWYYKFGCSSLDSLEYRPNNLLFDKLIRMACEDASVAEIDLGLSGAGASYKGLVRFKESMGGQRNHITYYEQLPKGYNQQAEKEFKSLLSSITQVIVKNELDMDTTDQFSKIMYPYFL